MFQLRLAEHPGLLMVIQVPASQTDRTRITSLLVNRPGQPAWTSIVLMSAGPAESGDDHDVIHLGGETAVVVPLHEYGMLAALRKRASAEAIAEAEIDAAIAEHEAWKAGGRPGGTIPHEVAMAELLGGQ